MYQHPQNVARSGNSKTDLLQIERKLNFTTIGESHSRELGTKTAC